MMRAAGSSVPARLRSRRRRRIVGRMSKVKSMTGYGRAVFSVGGTDFSAEASSVNQRGLAVSVSAPPEWMPEAERLLAPLVRACAARGKISLALRAGTGNAAHEAELFSWDEEAVARTLEKMKAAARRAGTLFEPTAEIYLRLAEHCRARGNALPALGDEAVSAAVAEAAASALKNLTAMREREGVNLEKDLRERLARLRDWAEKIREASAGTVAHYRDALLARLAALETETDSDDPRLLKEIALFADRCDISEELTRLASHFAQFESCLSEAESGRKLDFICQEMAREINTTASKANNLELTRIAISMKNINEQIREQIQNIE